MSAATGLAAALGGGQETAPHRNSPKQLAGRSAGAAAPAPADQQGLSGGRTAVNPLTPFGVAGAPQPGADVTAARPAGVAASLILGKQAGGRAHRRPLRSSLSFGAGAGSSAGRSSAVPGAAGDSSAGAGALCRAQPLYGFGAGAWGIDATSALPGLQPLYASPRPKPGKDAGSGNSSAIHASEDAPRRRFAAASAVSGSPDRTRSVAQTHFPPAITGSGRGRFHPYNCQRSSRPAA